MVSLIIYIILVAGMWKMFEKAGIDGWKAIIPIYNIYLETVYIAKKEWWYVILYFIPIVNIFAIIKVHMEVAKNFRISSPLAFSLGMTFLSFIFYPILGFGDYQFIDDDYADVIYFSLYYFFLNYVLDSFYILK